ncbi:MAG: hypothetical protein EHM72_08130 [Calditrichaeota bacterium]|nr:MAG: hypothetical protein EHM72_08130 [Calditrichota bacterium]
MVKMRLLFKELAEDRPLLRKMAQRTAWISGVFALFLSVLLILNYLQFKTHDPLHSPALTQLMQQLQSDSENQALKEQIRALDLLARKAFFIHQWQLRTGSFLLLVSIILMLSAIKYLRSLERILPSFDSKAATDELLLDRLSSRRLVIWSGAALVLLAFVAGLLSENQLKDPKAVELAKTGPSLEELRQNWPHFRGPDTNGHAYADSLPTTWNGSSGEGILWKVKSPKPGFNSIIVWGSKLFFSGADEQTQSLYCLDVTNGNTIWEREIKDVPGHPSELPDVTKDTGFAAPTCATDGQNLYTLFANGDIACVDLQGNFIWSKNLGLPKNHYGHSSSLVTYNDLLLVQYDHGESKSLLALRKSNGKTAYQTKRNDVQLSWASPLLVQGSGRDEIILSATPFVIAYHPSTGKEIWRNKCMDGEVAPSPAYAAGRVFVVNEYARLAAIDIANPSIPLWIYEEDLSEVSSPVANDELVFMPSSYGTLTCLDALTGVKQWSHDFDTGFYSSPIIAGDTIYLMDLKGVTHLIKAAREYQLIGENALGESAVTIPAFMTGRIYIRGDEHIYCIGS